MRHIRSYTLLGVLFCSLFSVNIFGQCSVNLGNDINSCPNSPVQLGANLVLTGNTGNVSYSWDNGAGSIANPSVSPSTTTTYTVTVSGAGCPQPVTDQITVSMLPAPTASFTFGPNNACSGTVVNFVSNVANCTSCEFLWNFGDPSSGASNTSAVANPTHTFNTVGNGNSSYTVTLTATGANGCQTIVAQTVIVKQAPNAVLTEDVNFTQCLGLGSFYAYVTNASTPASNTNYHINWGDGTPAYNSSTPPNSFEHIYAGIDIWTLVYTVTGSNGCTDVTEYTVTNISNPAIGAATNGNTLQCGPVPICFDLTNYQNNFSQIVYDVNFGDGSPVETYTQSTLPDPVCHVYSASSCPGAYTFSITAVSNCPTPTVAQITPIQIFTGPTAQFTNPPSYCVNSPVPFTNTSIPGYNQGCNANTVYTWNFGDPVSGTNNTSTGVSPTHTYTTPGTYTITMTASNGGNPQLACSPSTVTHTICIEPPPVPVVGVNTHSGCVPLAITTTNTSTALNTCTVARTWIIEYAELPCTPNGGAYVYTGGTNASSNQPNITLQSEGIYTLRYRMQNSCGIFEDIETVTVNTVPMVDVSTPVNGVCAGTSGTSSAVVNGCSLPTTYAWTFAGGSPATASSTTPPAVIYANAGNHNVTLAVTNACGTTTDVAVMNVLNIPDVQITATNNDLTICNGQQTTLTATGAATYTWSPSTYLSSTIGSTVTSTPTAGVTYTVTGTSGSCTDTGTITLTVDPLPNITPSGTFALCVGETEQLGVNVTGGSSPYTSYTWTPSTNLSANNISNPVFSGTSSTTYSVTVTDNNGCQRTANVPVTVNPLPLTNAGPDINLCNQPVATQLTGYSPTTGGTGIWSGTGVTTTGLFTPNGNGQVTLEYCFTNSATGCEACDERIITITEPTAANAGPDTTFCLNAGSYQLPAGTWSGSPQVTASGLFTPSVVGPHNLTVLQGNGSCQTSDQVLITVRQLPVVNAGNDVSICAGDTTNLSSICTNCPNGPIVTYSWTGASLSGTGIGNPQAWPATTTNYTLNITDAAGCLDSDQVLITVNPLPVVNAGADLTLCNQPVPTPLTGFSPTAGGTGVWTGTNVTPTGVFTPTGNGQITLQYCFENSTTGCEACDERIITIINPTNVNAGPDTSLCLNAGTFQLPVGTWTGSPQVSASGLFTPSVVGPHNLTVTQGTGSCQTTDQITITVLALPVANAGNDAEICLGTTINLNSSCSNCPNGPISICSWTGGPVSNSASCNTTATPTVTTVYNLVVIDPAGCVDNDQMSVTVHPLPTTNAGLDLTLCNQPIATQISGTPAGGTWTGSGITSTGVFTPSATGSFTMTYTYANPVTNCPATDQMIISVNEPVIAVAGPDVTLCLNEGSYQLTGFTPTTGGVWSGPGVTSAASGIIHSETAGVGIHTLTISTGAGTCLTTDQMVLTIQALPVVSAGPGATICGNAAIFDLAGFVPTTGGTWVGTGITNSTTGTFDPALGSANNSLLYWYEDAVTGCRDSSTTTVIVNAVPIANFNLATQGCTNSSVSYNNTSVGGNTYIWRYGNGAELTGFQPSYTYPNPGIFQITQIVANLAGCRDTAFNTTEIINPPVAELVLSTVEGCAPLYVPFNNHSIGQYMSYQWNLGTATSTDSLPSPITYQQGADVLTYPISLTVTNYCGTDTDDADVTILPQPQASFGTNLDAFCSPFPVLFNNTSVGLPDTFEWDFGDGDFSYLEEPGGHTYYTGTENTDYTIWLYLENECGADTANYTITVWPNTVTGFFNTNVLEGCEPLMVEFTDHSDGATQISYYLGDGYGFNSDDNPTQVYNEGQYTIYQYADNGCSYDTTSITITVFDAPDIDFTTNVPSSCTNNPIQFTPTPDTAIELFWDFGDGSISGLSNPTHEYENGNNYTISLTGVSDNGCTTTVTHPINIIPGPEASFTAPSVVGCSPFQVCFSNTTTAGNFYTWNFGDGNTANTQSPCHTYQNVGATALPVTVQMIAQDIQLCADTFSYNLVISPQPISAFTLNGFDPCLIPQTLLTTNLSQFSNGYQWLLGTQQISTAINTSVTFPGVGEYDISLVATNQYGCSATSTSSYDIHELPQASLSAVPRQGCIPLEVHFSNQSTNATNVLWSLGNGVLSNENNPTFTYNQAGVYDITLIAYNDGACSDTLFANDYIMAFPFPIADFWMDPEETNIFESTIEFHNTSYNAYNSQWYFGDGAVSHDFDVTYTYPNAGIWPVTLTVWNMYGCRAEKKDVVIINDMFNVYVPNAFTPDGDGINEVFLPEISGKPFINKYTLRIFDRWGTTIFETNDYDQAWVGDVRNGDYYAKDDAYNWQIVIQLKGSDEERTYNGHVFILR